MNKRTCWVLLASSLSFAPAAIIGYINQPLPEVLSETEVAPIVLEQDTLARVTVDVSTPQKFSGGVHSADAEKAYRCEEPRPLEQGFGTVRVCSWE